MTTSTQSQSLQASLAAPSSLPGLGAARRGAGAATGAAAEQWQSREEQTGRCSPSAQEQEQQEGECNTVPVAEVHQHTTTLSHEDSEVARPRRSSFDGRDSASYRGSAESVPKGLHRIGKSVLRGIVSRLCNKQYFRDWSLCDSEFYPSQSATLMRINKIFAATLYIFFAQLLPALTFGFFTQEATNGEMGVIETILSMAIGGSLFALFAGQPMVVVGVTVSVWCVREGVGVPSISVSL